MPFPHKTATEIEYLRELANIASTLAACNEHECVAAAGLIGQEIQEALRTPAQEDHQQARTVSLEQAVSYAQISPGPTLGETGIPLSPIDSAVAEATRAKIDMNRFTANSGQSNGYSDASRAYNKAIGLLEDEIDKAARANPDIGTAVNPLESAKETLMVAYTALNDAESVLNDAARKYASAASKLNDELAKATPVCK